MPIYFASLLWRAKIFRLYPRYLIVWLTLVVYASLGVDKSVVDGLETAASYWLAQLAH